MRRLTGYAGLACALLLITGFVLDFTLIFTTGGAPQMYASSIGADMTRAASNVAWHVELWVYLLATLPFAVYLVAWRASYARADDAPALLGVIAGLIFISLHTIHNAAYATILQGLAPTYAAGSALAATTEQIARTLVSFAEISFLPGGGLGGLCQSIALAAIGIAQLRAGAIAASRLALAAAALTGAGYLQVVVPAAPTLPIVLLGWVVFIAWIVVTSLSAIASAQVSSTAASPSAAAAASHAG